MEDSKEEREEVFNRFAQSDGPRPVHEPTENIRGGSCMPENRLPFTERTLRRVAALAVDFDALLERYRAKTKGRNIRNPDAYLLAMGREDAARAAGVSIETIRRMNSGPEAVKAVLAEVQQGASHWPPQKHIAMTTRHIKHRGMDAVKTIENWKKQHSKGFPSIAAAIRSLDNYVANEVLRSRSDKSV